MGLLHFLPLGLLALTTPTDALHLQLSGRPNTPHLHRRTSMSGTMSTLGDTSNIVYTTNITLNNAEFSVMIDTGSSDLWVSSTVPNADDQQLQGAVTYASGSASGEIMSATLGFADFSIDSQFFISAPDGNAAAGAGGLIGLGPSSGSNIRFQANSSAGNPPLDRIFTSNSSVSSFIAILLQRSDDPEDRYPGDLGVGEVLTDYKDILNQPQLPVTLTPLQGNQHWQTLLDVNGLIANGKQVDIKTQVTGAQTNNATVVFDTGFTLPQVSPGVAEALYGNIPGAALTNVSSLGEIWTLPCDQQVNATFLFGGVEFPIHPLDLNCDEFDLNSDSNGQPTCVGAFQPYSFDINQDGDVLFDMILGMAFLRNAYLLVNFGNLLDAATPSTTTAYIQLLPITNATQAAADFATVRDGGNSNSDTGEVLSTSRSGSRWSRWLSRNGLIVGIVVGAIVLILAIAGVMLCRRRRNRNRSQPATWVASVPSYRPINDPSPQAAYDMHMAPGTQPGYNTGYKPEYQTAWDSRH